MGIPVACRTPSDGAARAHLLFVAPLLLICGATAFIGVVPNQVFGSDNFLLLDSGWRIVCGQRPHVDFFSACGPVMYLVTGLGLVLSDASPNAIGYGNAIAGLLVGLWAYWLGHGRLLAVPRLLYGLYLTLLVVAPYPIGAMPFWSSHAMTYNRYGYALTGLVLLECVQRLEGTDPNAGEFLGGLSTGVAMSLALFTKASYFGVCLPLVAASFVFRGLSRRRLGGLAAGFGVITLALLAYLKFDVLRVVKDLRMAAAARSKMMELGWPRMIAKLVGQVPSWLILSALLLYGSSQKKWARTWLEKRQLLLWGLLVFVVDAMLLTSNMQPRGMPILAAFGIVAANWMTAERRRAGSTELQTGKQDYLFVLLLCGMLSLPQFCSDLAGLGYGVVKKSNLTLEESRVRFSAPRLASMVLCNSSFPRQRATGGVYATGVNEGVALLQKYCGPGDRVITFDQYNPFPYALGWRPAWGGMAAAAHNNWFTDEMRPSDDEYFGNATVVLVPKEPALNRLYYNGFYRLYSPGLAQRYRLVAESGMWWLYKLK